MRIAFDAKRAFNNGTGLGNYSRFIINGLHELFPKEEYYLYTNKSGSHFNDPNAAFYIVQPSLPSWLHSYWRTFKVASDLKNKQVDIYHGLSNELPVGIKKTGIKSVVTIHDLIFMRFPELYPTVDLFFYKQKFKYACEVADIVVAISEQTKQDIIDFFSIDPAKIKVVYQDCNALYHQHSSEDYLKSIRQKYNLPQKYLLCVGTLEKRKNQLSILEALKQLNEIPDLQLVLVGKDTDYRKELNEFVQKHKLQSKVKFLSYIPFADLPGIYHNAWVFIYPSIFEGFGIPIVEALNCRIPVISSKGSCFSEAGGPDSVYITPGNVDEISAAVAEVWSNENHRNIMITNGLKYVSKFRKEHTILQLHEIYTGLVEIKPGI